MRFNVGDKVMIVDAAKIEFAQDHFKDGDITEVVEIDDFLHHHGIYVKVPEHTVDDATDFNGGVPTLYILGDMELQHLAKVLPDNAKTNDETARIKELEEQVEKLKRAARKPKDYSGEFPFGI